MDEERGKRRDVEATLAEERRLRESMNDRFQQAMLMMQQQRQGQQQPQQPQLPDPEEQPFEHMDARLRMVEGFEMTACFGECATLESGVARL